MARPAKPPHQVFSPKLLLAVPLVCALLALWLIPTERRLLERQIADKAWGRAIETLRKLPARERAKQARYYALLEIQLERRLLAADDPVALRNLLAHACQLAEPFQFEAAFLVEISAMLDQVRAKFGRNSVMTDGHVAQALHLLVQRRLHVHLHEEVHAAA